MPRFRARPIEVEAFQWIGEVTDMTKFREFFVDNQGRTAYHRYYLNKREDEIVIRTLEGEMTARSGDWIVKSTDLMGNEYWPVRADIFEKRYESVEEVQLA